MVNKQVNVCLKTIAHWYTYIVVIMKTRIELAPYYSEI